MIARLRSRRDRASPTWARSPPPDLFFFLPSTSELIGFRKDHRFDAGSTIRNNVDKKISREDLSNCTRRISIPPRSGGGRATAEIGNSGNRHIRSNQIRPLALLSGQTSTTPSSRGSDKTRKKRFWLNFYDLSP